MEARIRFIGEANRLLGDEGEERTYPFPFDAELVHVGDLVRHPLFSTQQLYVVAREIDLVQVAVKLWVDVLPGAANPASASESTGARLEH